MDLDRPMALLGGLSAADFMRRHWQKKPLLVRAACPDALADVDRSRLFALAARDDVESRLVVRAGARWSVRPGPFARRALPALATPAWTLLVQGVDLHDDEAHRLLRRFRFVADARLDDVMCSYASDGGGVGPHVDSYDVFLLQSPRPQALADRPRRPKARLRDDVPLKMLADFEPSQEWLLEPGDMLYLPPGWGHDGVAVGECITASIGFRAPRAGELAADVAQRLAEAARDDERAARAGRRRYRDAGAPVADRPARIPESLQHFADAALDRLLADRVARSRALGEVLSEPKPGTWFERAATPSAAAGGDRLDRRTRMLYDDRHVFINGEAYRAGGRDATLMRRLADRAPARRRRASPRLSDEAGELLAEWLRAGWCAAVNDTFRRGDDMTAESIIPIGSRAEFLDAVRDAFALAEQAQAREIVMVDPNFADWPLNEPRGDRVARPLDRFAPQPDRPRAQLRRAGAASAALRRMAPAVGARGPVPKRSRARGRADPDPAARSRPHLHPHPRPRPLPRHRVESTGRSDRMPRSD